MSDTYIPQLMELNSYWQKAVEDAIQDTVKGEEKLQTALRNRKKVNEKLKRMGLEPLFSWWPFKKGNATKPKEEKEDEHNLDSDTSDSSDTVEGESFHELESRMSRQTDTPFDDKQEGPMRPMFGNGSLEKIKRSQNSFNCEPMGDKKSEERSVPGKEDAMYHACVRKNSENERNKNVEWLHIREDHDFENSDSASSSGGEEIQSVQLMRHPFALSKKVYLNRKIGGNSKKKITKTIRKMQKQQPTLLSENESNNTVNQQRDLRRRLELALTKREILKKKRKGHGGSESKVLLKVSMSAVKAAKKRTKGKKQLSAFIRFYLNVYKELCMKMPVKRISGEAAKRWQEMTAKEKADWEDDGRTTFDF